MFSFTFIHVSWRWLSISGSPPTWGALSDINLYLISWLSEMPVIPQRPQRGSSDHLRRPLVHSTAKTLAVMLRVKRRRGLQKKMLVTWLSLLAKAFWGAPCLFVREEKDLVEDKLQRQQMSTPYNTKSNKKRQRVLCFVWWLVFIKFLLVFQQQNNCEIIQHSNFRIRSDSNNSISNQPKYLNMSAPQ